VRRWGAGTARALLIAARRFAADRCQLWACTLTFYSLLSIVPLVAMAFGIAKGFGLEEALHRLVGSITGWQGDISERIIRFALAFLQQARGGLIAGIGVAVLLWSVVSMLGNIEAALNAIWEIRRPRLLMRKFADYLSMMLVGTVLVIVSGSLTVAVAGQVRGITARMAVLGAAGDVVLLLLQLFPYLIVWALFSFIYIFMPNGPVPLRAGLVAGIVAGTAFQLVQWIYI
jgi:membrane protein